MLALPAVRPRRLALVKPRSSLPANGGAEETTQAEHVFSAVKRSPRAAAHLALLGDKRFLFSADRRGFVMYRRALGCSVAMGDAVGPHTEEMTTRFINMSRRNFSLPVIYQATSEHLDFYRSMGLVPRMLGQEAIVDLTSFSLEGSHRARLRQTLRRTERAGGTMEVVPVSWVAPLIPQLQEISNEWLARKTMREKGFSLGTFDPDYLKKTPLALVRVKGRIVAFANLWTGAVGTEVAVDLMRYTESAPYGVMEYLFTKLFCWAQQSGYSRFNLGMAPLAGVDDSPASGTGDIWPQLGRAVRDRGERYYNFEGIRVFKDKFRPTWEPRYIVAPRGLGGPWAAVSLMSMVSKGATGTTN